MKKKRKIAENKRKIQESVFVKDEEEKDIYLVDKEANALTRAFIHTHSHALPPERRRLSACRLSGKTLIERWPPAKYVHVCQKMGQK